MKYLIGLFLLFSFSVQSIVIRHDVEDERFKVSKDALPQLATFYFDGAHGVLIKPQWVLTAAHATFCVKTGGRIKVGSQLVEVEQVFIHKDYAPGKSHDIALVKLKQPVTDIQPFNINRKTNEKDMALWFIGIGGTGNGETGQIIDNYENQGQLRRAQNKVESAKGPLIKFVFDRGEQALELEGVSGGGDSGGPAYSMVNGQGTVYGISSRVDGRGIGYYGVTEIYSRVSFFSDWIEQVLQEENVSTISIPALKSLPAGLTHNMLPAVCADIAVSEQDL